MIMWEQGGPKFGGLQILPYASYVNLTDTRYRDPAGAIHDDYVWGTAFGTTSTFLDYRALFNYNGDGTTMTERTYYYDTGSSQYVLIWTATGVGIGSGLFDRLNIVANGNSGNVYFDSVAITIPEPSTILLLGIGGLLVFRRRSANYGGQGRRK